MSRVIGTIESPSLELPLLPTPSRVLNDFSRRGTEPIDVSQQLNPWNVPPRSVVPHSSADIPEEKGPDCPEASPHIGNRRDEDGTQQHDGGQRPLFKSCQPNMVMHTGLTYKSCRSLH